MRKTKIVCTIGPSSDDYEIQKKMLRLGMSVARLNMSHGTHEEHAARIAMLRKVRTELGQPLALMMDTKGPEVRLGHFAKNMVELLAGQDYLLTTRDVPGDETQAQVTYTGLPGDVSEGSRILIDDGLVELTVLSSDGQDIHCRVENSGQIGTYKGVNVPGGKLTMPLVTEKDIGDIIFGIEQGIDLIASSFTRTAEDVQTIRKLLQSNGGGHIQIFAKIENQQGYENIDDILDVADGIMVARGDLGVEAPIEHVPIIQKSIIHKCNIKGKPVITATQMLDSMIRNPRPTRAETNDIANAILDGTDAIMLSGETAAGKYPIEAVSMMGRVADYVEASVAMRLHDVKESMMKSASITNAVSFACYTIALDLNARAIITPTYRGVTARNVAKYRPHCLLVATTAYESTYHQLSVVWGVMPVRVRVTGTTDEMIDDAIECVRSLGIVKARDVVVISSGVPVSKSGSTNLIKVEVVPDS